MADPQSSQAALILAMRELDPDVLIGLRAVDEDGTFLTDLVTQFRRDADRFVVEVSAGIRDLDEARVCRAAHSLRGGSGCLGLVGLSTQCLEFEELGRSRRFESIGVKLAQFASGAEQALEALDAFRKGGR